jgi:hypothetical protein
MCRLQSKRTAHPLYDPHSGARRAPQRVFVRRYNGGEVKMNINRRVVCRGCRKKADGKSPTPSPPPNATQHNTHTRFLTNY